MESVNYLGIRVWISRLVVVESDWKMYLSPPVASEADIQAVVQALRAGWLAPVGPELTRFEDAIAEYLGVKAAVALNSGSAAIHLALRYLGVRPGDAVLVPSVTFAATAFPVTYEGGTPLFVDIDDSWNMDPEAAEAALQSCAEEGIRVAAAIPVDLYGTPADYARLLPLFEKWGVPVVADSAESLGSRSQLGMCGSFGRAGILSFNGNKIMTTSGGGMLVSNDADLAATIRKWSTQSREERPWYEHKEVGFNYRLSNVLAALGVSQLSRIEEVVAHRRRIREWYREALADVEGLSIQHDPPWGKSNAWLTVARIGGDLYRDGASAVRLHLAQRGIEARHVWKPLHQQPVFAGAPTFLSGQADKLFEEGICLPSGTAMEHTDVEQVAGFVTRALKSQ